MKLILLLLCLSLTAMGSDLYFGQTSAGSNNGTSCANAYAYNDGSHGWGLSGAQTAGNVLHVCGVWTGTGGTTWLTAVASGSNGSPITVVFEHGAIIQEPYLSVTGAFILSGFNYWTVDFGGNGYMQSTLNGTSGWTCPGGTCTSQFNSVGIVGNPCGNCEIKGGGINGNPGIFNLYVHEQCFSPWSGCDTAPTNNAVNAVLFGGANFKIHDFVAHDCSWCLLQNYSADTQASIYNMNIYNMDHGLACAGGAFTLASLVVNNNHFHDMANWDTGPVLDAYHHDGIHCFNGSGGKIQNAHIYNNVFDGDQGFNVSSWMFLEGGWTDSSGTAYIFNNLVIGTNDIAIGQLSLADGANYLIVNNTCIAAILGNGGACFLIDAITGMTFENNIAQSTNQALDGYFSTSFTTIDYNAYANLAGGNPYWQFNMGAIQSKVIASWQSMCSCDSNSIYQAYPNPWANLSSQGVPSAGFAGIGLGVNLTSLGITALNSDLAGAARPSSGAWTIGAYQFVPAVIKGAGASNGVGASGAVN